MRSLLSEEALASGSAYVEPLSTEKKVTKLPRNSDSESTVDPGE